MANSKCTAIFSYISEQNVGGHIRAGGWSESVYSTTDASAPALRSLFAAWCQKRAGLLPTSIGIIGQRYQNVSANARAISAGVVFNGTATGDQDIPQVALQFTLDSKTSLNQRKLVLRGIPDGRVVGGMYSPTLAYSQAVSRFLVEMEDRWLFRGRNLNAPQFVINYIEDNGTVHMGEAAGVGLGSEVQILRTALLHGGKAGAFAKIVSFTNTSNFVIAQWSLGLTTSGMLRVAENDYFGIDATAAGASVPDIVTRKVGRPFFQYRGRQTSRR